MMDIIINGIVAIVTAVITGVVTFLQTKKKYYADVDSSLIQNLHEALDFYKKVSDDNKIRLEEISEKNMQLEEEIKELREQVFKLMSNVCYKYDCLNRERVEVLKKKKHTKQEE